MRRCALDGPGRPGLGVGIENTFVRDERPGMRRLDEYELTQHDRRWREDLELAAASGATMVRWGVPWWRVEPQPGRFETGWVEEVAEHTERLGLTVCADLVHYGTPAWLARSFADPGYPEAVARYAVEMVRRLRGLWRWWTPVNEPMITALWCGRDGRWPPYLTGGEGFARVVAGVVEGAQLTTAAIRDADPAARVLHVEAGFRWRGVWPQGRELMDEWRFVATDLILGRRPGAQLLEHLASSGVDVTTLDRLVDGGQRPDVLGLNYYPGFTTQRWVGEKVGPEPVEAGVEGLVDLVRTVRDRYDLPVAVTETSVISEDPGAKVDWMEAVDTALVHDLADVDLRAVFWFPFLDMFDWDYREGSAPLDDYRVPFGLVRLRRDDDGGLVREPTDALAAFRGWARSLETGGAGRPD